jgi:hypothetical protein
MATAIGNVLNEVLEQAIGPLESKIAELETRSASCECKETWHEGMSVEPGSLVTDRGSTMRFRFTDIFSEAQPS